MLEDRMRGRFPPMTCPEPILAEASSGEHPESQLRDAKSTRTTAGNPWSLEKAALKTQRNEFGTYARSLICKKMVRTTRGSLSCICRVKQGCKNEYTRLQLREKTKGWSPGPCRSLSESRRSYDLVLQLQQFSSAAQSMRQDPE